jgi:glycine dehydrogenase subunit 1
MSALGRTGLRRVAELCYHKAHYLATEIDKLHEYILVTSRPFFNEFVIRCPRPTRQINAALLERGIIGGFDLGSIDPTMDTQMLVCATEVHDRETLDDFVRVLEEVA